MGHFIKKGPLRGMNTPSRRSVLGSEVVGCGKGVVYLASLGRLTDIGLWLGKACYPCNR